MMMMIASYVVFHDFFKEHIRFWIEKFEIFNSMMRDAAMVLSGVANCASSYKC